MDVSIIIVSYNTKDVLRKVLGNVSQEAAQNSAEIFVVDNDSHDGSAEMVQLEFPKVRLIKSPVNLGYGQAINLAAKQALGKSILVLNSDAFFKPGALKLALQKMEEHRDAGIIGAQIIDEQDRTAASVMPFSSIKNYILRSFNLLDDIYTKQDKEAQVDWVCGAFLLIPKEVFEKVQGFDPRFFLYYEETDLCKRIHEAGYAIRYCPQIKIKHIGGESTKTIDSKSYLWEKRSLFLYWRKHYGPLIYIFFWLHYLRYKLKSLKGTPVPAGFIQAWHDTHKGTISPAQPW